MSPGKNDETVLGPKFNSKRKAQKIEKTCMLWCNLTEAAHLNRNDTNG